jgi:hypothetical protein
LVLEEWLYGKESFFPSMINLKTQCHLNQLMIPRIDSQCLLNMKNQSVPCSSFVQSFCAYIRFQALFDVQEIYILEKNTQKSFKFLLESYTISPMMISSTKPSGLNYSINYTIHRLKNGIIQTIGVSRRGLKE